jgi:hypothetical protein
MPSLEPIKGKISVLGFIPHNYSNKISYFFVLAIPDNSGIDVHFHLPTPASQHQ